MTEYQVQRQLVAWFRANWPQYSRRIRLSLNGINLPVNGSKAGMIINTFKASGMVKGESDLLFLIKTEKYAGLALELKTPTGKPTVEQLAYIKDMNQGGYLGVIAYSLEEAQEIIQNYLS